MSLRVALLSCSRLRGMAIVLGLGAGLTPALAQPQNAVRGRTNPEELQYRNAAVLHPSEEATTLMSRAKQGIEREDWKLVIDSLQRIIELPGEHVLSNNGQVYESARLQAQRQLAGLPAAGLAAYRLMYDDEAAALLAKAVAQHDLSLLRTVVDRYPITRVGDEAAMTLADWLIDESQYAEAAAVLQLSKSLYPDSDLPAWSIPARLAVCYAALGRTQRAEAVFNGIPATQPATTGGIAWTDRENQIKAFLQHPVHGLDLADRTSWPLAYGRPSRDGVMPAVEPTFADHLPWVVPLSASSGNDSASLDSETREHGIVPMASMVADDRLLLVKAGPVLQALDVDTFEVVWRRELGSNANDAAILEEPSDVQDSRADNDATSASLQRMLNDSVGSSISTAFGLALTVEWLSEPPALEQRQRMLMAAMPAMISPNRLVAYALKDGHPVWQSTSRAGENKLGAVEYLSAPVPVNGYLLVPCRANADLYAALLDPLTGKIVRQIYLCGTGGGAFNSLHALQPCVADNVVYIPTGRGVVIALDSTSWSIRWAVRYDAAGEHGTEGRWLPTPVIAVADSVLLAPPDADYLFCIDRATGETRWKREREDYLYIVAANDRHVWLGGKDVTLLDVETGHQIWKRESGEPTGHGIVSGDRLYMPTTKGLMAFQAENGERLEVKEPPGGGPLILGNLLAWNTTLYSTDLSETREFPDLERGYNEAEARHQSNPADPANAIRLARLELLRHSPGKALSALGELSANLKLQNPRRFEQATHMKVVSMLELAASGAVSSEQSLQLLQQARTTAVSPQDAVDSTLALADYHRRESRPLDACLQYLSLALSEQGDQMVSEGEDFQQRGRSIAVRRLADAAKNMDVAQKQKLDEAVRTAMSRAMAKRDTASLLWIAESGPLGEASCEAELILGKWAVEDLRFEQAEGFWTRVLRRSTSGPILAETTARLAALYLQPDELHLPVLALKLVDRLEHEFAALELPADVLELEGGDAGGVITTRPAHAKLLPGARIASVLRQRINPTILARHQAALAPVVLAAPGEPKIVTARGARPLQVHDDHIEVLADRWLTLVDGKKVEAYTSSNDTLLWPAELRLLNELAVESQSDSAIRVYGNGTPSPASAAHGLVDGQTLIVNSAYGIHAIGLLTGRRLWSRKFDPPPSKMERSGSDTWLWVQDGYVISVNRAGELEVSQASAGDRLVWKRKRSGRRWFAVRARGPYVVAVDERLEQLDVFRLDDGRYLGACKFQQPADPSKRVSIALFDDVVCGPVSPNEVAALELATPGVERWRASADSELCQLFKPNGELLALGDRAGRVQLIDPRTGKPAMPQVKTESCRDGVRDGTISGGMLYVCGFKQADAPAGRAPKQGGVAAIRMSDGKLLWQKGGFGELAYLYADVLDCSSNAIPIASLIASSDSNPQLPGNSRDSAKLELTVLDKATGDLIGEKIEATLDADAGASRILSLTASPGQIRVAAGTAQLRFPYKIVTR